HRHLHSFPTRRSSDLAATTDRVSIDGAKATVTQNVSVGVPDGALRLKEARTARVVVTIEPNGERRFSALRVTIRNLGPGMRGTADRKSTRLNSSHVEI